MKVQTYILILVASTLFSSCQNDNASMQAKVDLAVMDVNKGIVEDFPGKIPKDSKVNNIGKVGENSWREYDEYYRTEVLQNKEVHYFNNLQWTVISRMVRYENFLQEASSELKMYYLNEAMSREFINEPEIVTLMLLDLQNNELSDAQVAKYAGMVESKNKSHLTEENFIKHHGAHAVYYQRLDSLANIVE